MQAVRQIYESTEDTLVIHVPKSLQHRRVEVIVLPAEETRTSHRIHSKWPVGFLDQYIGCLNQDPLTRDI